MIQDALGQKDPRVAQMYIHRTSTMDAKIRQCQNDLIDRIINSQLYYQLITAFESYQQTRGKGNE